MPVETKFATVLTCEECGKATTRTARVILEGQTPVDFAHTAGWATDIIGGQWLAWCPEHKPKGKPAEPEQIPEQARGRTHPIEEAQ